jgi:hypothetical protein
MDEEGDRIRYELRTMAEGLSIDPDTGRMVWTPSERQAGRHRVAVVVTDGYGGSNELYFQIEVQGEAAAAPPVWPADEVIPAGTSRPAEAAPAVSKEPSIEPTLCPLPAVLAVIAGAGFFLYIRRANRR